MITPSLPSRDRPAANPVVYHLVSPQDELMIAVDAASVA
jgi:hypothetical protein